MIFGAAKEKGDNAQLQVFRSIDTDLKIYFYFSVMTYGFWHETFAKLNQSTDYKLKLKLLANGDKYGVCTHHKLSLYIYKAFCLSKFLFHYFTGSV